MHKKSKPTVAFFDFACCEGCQLTVLQLDEQLLTLLDHVEVVAWREAMTGAEESYDIAFCEGSITREQDIERLKRIRASAGKLVSLGTCASIACHNAMKNRYASREVLDMVYGPDADYDTIPARPISSVVHVDYRTFGCPVSLPEFVTVFKYILTGKEYWPPNQPVCVECKLKDNLCVFEKGQVCLGPVTRCGCDAICTSYGDVCQGCRGLMDRSNLEAAVRVLTEEQRHRIMAEVARKHSLTRDDVRARFAVYNSRPELNI